MCQVEALQLWSLFARHNIPMHLSLDDVYPALCHLFLVPASLAQGSQTLDAEGRRATDTEAALTASALEVAAALAAHSVR